MDKLNTFDVFDKPDFKGQYLLYGEWTKEQEDVLRKLAAALGFENDDMSVQFIFKARGSAGRIDPLDSYGSFGWKIVNKKYGFEKVSTVTM